MGADKERASSFQLIAGTNTNLENATHAGTFRDDLLARIDMWTFKLPALASRRDDIEPNLDFELERFARERGNMVRFDKEARERYLAFALSGGAKWTRNFRDLTASVTRMATLAAGGRIGTAVVDEEIGRLQATWRRPTGPAPDVSDEVLAGRELDRFDAVQLADVVRVCRESPTLSAAGRELFAVSRASKGKPNDADRLRKYLARFDMRWQELK
jgi:transcriptional regulatory protein RtcR